jgi:peptidoglycan/LPS O-acetylase OafA/YrhL
MLISVSNIPSLNGIRAVSVLLVFFAHAGYGDFVPGGFGVTVFFFLSGFLITSLLIDEFYRNNSISIKKFFIRRLSRLFPPLIVFLTVVYFLTYLAITPGGICGVGGFSQVFYFANYYSIFFSKAGGIPDGTGILWSLAVEEHFYIFYPMLILLGFRYLTLRQIGGAIALACILILAWRIILVTEYEVSTARTYYATDTRIDSILFGCLLAIFGSPLKKELKDCKAISWIELSILLVSFLVLIATFLYRDPVFRETFRYSIQGLALMPVFYFSIAKYESNLFKWLNFRVTNNIGLISYSFYLVHFVVIHALKQNTKIIGGSLIFLILSLSITLLVSIAMYAFIEKPMIKIRKSFRN